MSRIILLLAFLQLISVVNGKNVNSCNSSLITVENKNLNKFQIITPDNPTPFTEIGTQDFLQLKGSLRVVEIDFTEPHYVTGLSIRVNTQQNSPCNYVESEINLVEYELIINNKRVNIPKRSKVYKTFVKVSFAPTYATKVQIRRAPPTPDTTIYCIQYQLYGCQDIPMECQPLISYDYTQPIQTDATYTGECDGDWCSGGVGILTDANYENSLEFSESVQISLSFYKQVGIEDISLYLIHTDVIETESQYQVSMMQNRTVVLKINEVIDYIEFNLSSTSPFMLEEILITYWKHGTDQIDIPCYTVLIPEGLSVQNMIFIIFAVGIFMFIMGLITPFAVWFVKNKTSIRVKSKKRGNNVENNNKDFRTEHVYTDLHLKDSTTVLKVPTQYSIQEQTRIQPQISVPERDFSPNSTDALEKQVRDRLLDRRYKQTSLDSNPELIRGDTLMEDNSIYQSKSISNNKDLRFENLERKDSEVILSDNPHYVSGEEMKLSLKKRIQKIDAVNYENTTLSQDSAAEDFDAYNKLNHT